LTLSRDNYSKFIRAIKKFRGNEDAADLAEEVGSSFKVQFFPQCLQGKKKKNENSDTSPFYYAKHVQPPYQNFYRHVSLSHVEATGASENKTHNSTLRKVKQ